MKETTKKILDELIERYPKLSNVKGDILDTYLVLESAYKNGNKVLVCGNGGSMSDSEHIVGELLKRFKKDREIPLDVKEKLMAMGEEGKEVASTLEGSLPAISLGSHNALTSAFANDRNPLMGYAQQVMGLGNSGDVLIAISTSGNSKNCTYAVLTALAKGLKVVLLTGKTGGKLKDLADVSIIAPEEETYKIQELHLPIYHALCAMLEEEFF